MAESTVKSSAAHDLIASDVVWKTLRVVFGVVPIVAGLDKFTNLLTNWEHYLAPAFARLIPFIPHGFMIIVGIIEIIAGIGVLFTPWTRVFAWIVALWLICIAVYLTVFIGGVLAGGAELFVLGRATAFTLAAAVLGRIVLGLLGRASLPVRHGPLADQERPVGSLVDLVSSTNVAQQEDEALAA